MPTATEVVLPSRVARPLPRVALPPGALRGAPSTTADAAARAVIDGKLNAALREAILQEINSDAKVVEAFIDGLALDYRAHLDLRVPALVQRVVVPAMRARPELAKVMALLRERKVAGDGPTIAELLQPALPLAEHPLFAADVRRARSAEILRISKVSAALLDRIDAGGKELETWTTSDWDAAVAGHVLTVAQRDELRFTTDLSRMSGQRYDLVDAARAAKLNSVDDLVAWDDEQWVKLLRDKAIAPPEGTTLEVFAGHLAKNVRTTYPARYFAKRVVDRDAPVRLAQAWTDLGKLAADNPEWTRTLDLRTVDWTGVGGDEQRLQKRSLTDAAALLGRYRRLGVGDVLADATQTPAQQRAEIGRRVAGLERFLANHANDDLRFLNLLSAPASVDGKAVDWNGIAAADQRAVRHQVMAYQRVLHLTPDPKLALSLLHSGLDGSAAISDLGYRAFLERTGLSEADGGPIYHDALQRSAAIANTVQTLKDVFAEVEQDKPYQGLHPALVNDLKSIDGWAELFGSTTYCECEDCHSIFSPAAYFVDLMYYIDQNITLPAFTGKPLHPLRLRLRRPDLWFLKLTCANTDTLIPHLTLVNEILAAYLERTLNVQHPLQALATDRSAIGLPFHAPLASLREGLRDWDLSLLGVYQLLGAGPAAIDHETLGLSDEEWSALVSGASDLGWIRFPTANHTEMDAVDFMAFAGLTRDELSELGHTKLGGGFMLQRVKLSNDIQSFKEVVTQLDDGLLDRIGRFVRLARKTGYRLTELDEILSTPRIAGTSPIGDQGLAALAAFKRLQGALGLSVELLIAVLDHIPRRPLTVTEGAQSLAEQRGVAAFTGAGGFPVAFHHAHFNTSDPTDAKVDPKLPALLNLVGVTESELLGLFEHYQVAMPFAAGGDISLTVPMVDLLFSHATLARTWGIELAELSLVIEKLTGGGGGDFRTLVLVERLREVVTTLRTLPLSFGELFALLDPAVPVVTIDQLTPVVSELADSGARLFTTSALAGVSGLTPDDTAAIFAQLTAAQLIEPAGGKFALSATYTPLTDLGAVLQPPHDARKAEIHAALMPFHFAGLLASSLAGVIGLTAEDTLPALAFARPGWDAPAMLTALATPIVDGVASTPADLAPLLALANDLARVTSLLGRLTLTGADLWFVAQYPGLFGIDDIQALRVVDVVSLRIYRDLLATSGLSAAEAQDLLWQYQVRAGGGQPIAPAPLFSPATAAVPLFAEALAAPERAPRVASAPAQFSTETVATVQSPLNADEIVLMATRGSLDATILRSVFLSQPLPTRALAGLARARALYNVCNLLRLQGHSLPRLLARDFMGASAARQLLWAALEHKYPDAEAREKGIDPHTDALNMLLRDALCDYIIARSKLLHFKSRADLYNYFLIDVEMGGCFRTSRLVAALSSLQLYVYRCLVNLEISESDGLSVLSKIDAADIAQEWEWRRNYRVWEANRKVFVYPESYIEPELRDDKTPLFEELEDSLLQKTITIEAAEEAYSTYLVGLSDLAQMKIVGACFDKDSGDYWFFARTHADPFTYSVRCFHSASNGWEPWESIDLGINAAYVSPLMVLGRLYLFWVDVTSTDRTNFVDGNTIFQAIDHHVTLHYSHRENAGKWVPEQKKTLTDKLADRYVYDGTPGFIQNIYDGFMFVYISKSKTQDMVDYYRSCKTFGKVIATAGTAASPELLTIHYLRQRQRTELSIVTTTKTTDSEGNTTTTTTTKSVSDATIDGIYVAAPDGSELDFTTPHLQGGVDYVIGTLDLINNELSGVSVNRHNDTTTDQFYYRSYGSEAVGLLYHPSGTESYSLILRRYASSSRPIATDDMLISTEKQGGKTLSTTTKIKARDAFPVIGALHNTVLQYWKNQHFILKKTGIYQNTGAKRRALRLNSTLDGYLIKVLFTSGIDEFLSKKTQTTQGEEGPLLLGDGGVELAFEKQPANEIPFDSSFGNYYKELFFHIPALIANQLNAGGSYQDAKYWYEKIFNPAAQAKSGMNSPKDRVWQYQGFANVTVPMLRQLLTNKEIIAVYRKDPFNPHAIARLRLSAYQKNIVMKYVDNLLDWGDDLFTQGTMESVNEATMLYVFAGQILGPRPVSVGKCPTADENTLTYAVLRPAIAQGSEFLFFVENLQLQYEYQQQANDNQSGGQFTPSHPIDGGLGAPSKYQLESRLVDYDEFVDGERMTGSMSTTRDPGRGRRPDGIMRHYLPAFCVPPNEVLMGYWDRIEDRLYKIRNCLDINGQFHLLDLFQPPIDPMLLVRAKAAGLSLEDVLREGSEPLPAYRFSYLAEKARQYIATVQAFGSALQSALEKKDGEALADLRLLHEKNLLSLNRSVKQQHIAEADAAVASLYSNQQNVQNRVDYYSGLISAGLNGWEITEQVLKHTASAIRISEAVLHMATGICYLLPDVGSPFAMKYGGQALGSSGAEFANWASSTANSLDGAASGAGLEAGFQRRREDWAQQLKVAREDLKDVGQKIIAAEIKQAVAQKELEIHDKQLEQSDEVRDFYASKFTNDELYTYLSAQLLKLYRQTYEAASRIARQAERAFQFERDATDFFIQGDNWQSDRSGLLAGERLLLQLQQMEQTYMESNVREIEVSQPFSLLQLDPGALQTLQTTGKCSFAIPEVLFDMQYPGQYRRLLKSVRLTIPCVVGPYTNVGATLRLDSSQVRRSPEDDLVDVPSTMTRTIATSNAQNDGGVFDLNFRDERYLPFEGAGAVSQWSLTLPGKLRMFNYASLSDVIINLSYVARYDGAFATEVEDGIVNDLKAYALANGLFRLVSLRHEFPDAFYQLMHPPAGQAQKTTFTLTSAHFPAWLDGLNLLNKQVQVWPRPIKGKTITPATLTLKVASSPVGNWDAEGRGTASVGGSPVRSWAIDAGASGLDPTKLDDLCFLIKYSVS